MGEGIVAQKIINSILESIIFLLFFLSFTQKNKFGSRILFKSIIFIVSYSIFCTFITRSLPMAYRSISILIFIVLVMSFLLEIKIVNSLIIMILSSVYIMSIESFILIIFSLKYGIGLKEVLELPDIGPFIGYSIFFSEMIIFCIIRKKIKKNRITNYLSEKSKDGFFMYGIIQIFMAALLVISIQGSLQNKVKIGVYNSLVYSIFIVFIVLGFFDYKKKIKLYKLKANYELSQQHVENLEAIVDIIRKEKHDYSNTINVLNAMCVQNKDRYDDKMKSYLSKVIKDIKVSNKSYDTGNKYIDGLLSVKNNYAMDNNIKLEVDMDIPLTVADVYEIDFVSIVSNIIDNAIYELKKYEEIDYKVISLYGYCENNKYCLAISNNGPQILEKDTVKIFQKGFSTKKEETDDHGYGLFIVEEIVSRNKGKISVKSNDEDTEFLFEFNIKKEFCGKNIDELINFEYV